MIWIKSFESFESFKNVFGVRECGNGNKARMNKILLGCLNDRKFFHLAVTDRAYSNILEIDNMADLKLFLLTRISQSSQCNRGFDWHLQIDGIQYGFVLPDLQADNDGICMDGDTGAIRYINHANGRKTFKMKAGKFFTKIMESCEFGRNLPQQAKSWLGEEFKTAWQAYAERQIAKNMYTFHYGDDAEDFTEIYSSDNRRGDFKSCMTDKGYEDMYHNSAKCHAAWLTDGDGLMFARCVIWDEVYDEETGETLRLAERQYSDGVQDRYKKMLVDELIERKLIDGYKQIGAFCHDNRNFVLNDGTSIRGHELSVELNVDWGDHVSYMDSFVYYDMDEHRAYNYNPGYYHCQLDTTDGYMDDDECIHEHERWSAYNSEWIDEDEACYVEQRDDYFYQSQVVTDTHGNCQFEDDCVVCEHCGEYVLEEEAHEIEDKYFCDNDCANLYFEENGYNWDDYNECYTDEDTFRVKFLLNCVWVGYDMRESTFDDFNLKGEIREVDGMFYLVNDARSRDAYESMTQPALVVT